MNRIENKFFKEYKGLKSSVISAYFVAFLPLAAAILGLLSYLLWGEIGTIGLIGGQFYYLIVLIPTLFLSIDLYAIIIKKRELTSFKETVKRNPELFILLGFLVWIIISMLLQILVLGKSLAYTTVVQTFYVQEGIMLFIYYALIVCTAFFVKDRKVTKNIIFIILIMSLILGLFALIDPSGTFWFQKENNTFWASMFINSNHYGYVLTITTTLSATLFCVAKKKWLMWFSFGANIFLSIILMFNDTLGSLLAVFAALIILPILLSWFKGKFKAKYLVPLAVFVVTSFACFFVAEYVKSTYQHASFFEQFINIFKELFVIAEAPVSETAKNAGSSRWDLWLKAIDEIASSPIIGTGNVLLRPHNEYLQYAQVFGIPALIIYLSAFVVIMVKAIKHRKKLSSLTMVLLMSVLAYLIGAFFGNTMPHTMPLFCLVLGFLIRYLNEDISMAKTAQILPDIDPLPSTKLKF